MSNKDFKELNDSELKQVSGGLNVYSDDETITMYFSSSDSPSELLYSIKNYVNKQLNLYFDRTASENLQNLLNRMTANGKTYLKINYTKSGEFITDYSINTMF